MANVKATDLIDFTRASAGYYLDSDGVLKEAPVDTPRIEYDADGNLLGLLIEEARTNLFTYSEDFSNWTSYSANHFTINYATAPDGTQTATRFNPQLQTDPGNSTKTLRLYKGVNSTAGNVVSFSVFVKPVQSSSFYIGNPDGADVDKDLLIQFNADQSSGKSAWNLKTKTWELEDSDHTTFQEEYPNGWYRVGIIYTVANNDSNNNHFINFGNRTSQANFDPYPSGLEDAYIWGAQVEVGSFATSYIKNEGTSSGKARSADVASIDVDQFGYNQSEGTLFVDYSGAGSVSAKYVVGLNSGSISSYIGISPSRYQGNTFSTSFSGETEAKMAAVYKASDYAISVKGATPYTVSSGAVPTGITTLTIGDLEPVSNRRPNCHIKSITYTPKRLSNAKLQELTK